MASRSFEEKSNVAVVANDEAAGPETIVVLGSTTVQVYSAGVASTMPPIELVALTRSS